MGVGVGVGVATFTPMPIRPLSSSTVGPAQVPQILVLPGLVDAATNVADFRRDQGRGLPDARVSLAGAS